MQENLIGYLLGALDGPEHDAVQRELDADPRLKQELLDLEAKLAPLEQGRWQFDPPPGLATRTCQLIAAEAERVQLDRAPQPKRSPQRRSRRRNWAAVTSEWNPRKHGWDFVDVAVAAGIFFAAALLFFPAIANSRQQARLLACQNKLRTGSVALSVFGERNNGVLPYIPPQGKGGVAGYYAVQLMDAGFLAEHTDVLCPTAQLSSEEREAFRIPSVWQLRAATGEKLAHWQRTMGGSYLYTLGHMVDRRHRATVNRGRDCFPVMADGMASEYGAAQFSSHGDQGINVVFEGGNVRYIVGVCRSHPYFVSDQGLVEAGNHPEDAALGPSWARPVPGGELDPDQFSTAVNPTPIRRLLGPLGSEGSLFHDLSPSADVLMVPPAQSL